jgi:hypothetical protein
MLGRKKSEGLLILGGLLDRVSDHIRYRHTTAIGVGKCLGGTK